LAAVDVAVVGYAVPRTPPPTFMGVGIEVWVFIRGVPVRRACPRATAVVIIIIGRVLPVAGSSCAAAVLMIPIFRVLLVGLFIISPSSHR
jgi:hypothetical protein